MQLVPNSWGSAPLRERMVSVPAWGGEKEGHLRATRTVSGWLGANGYRHAMRVRPVKTEVIERAGYDRVASGKG